ECRCNKEKGRSNYAYSLEYIAPSLSSLQSLFILAGLGKDLQANNHPGSCGEFTDRLVTLIVLLPGEALRD
ncbi:hypothetical protein J6590_017842, partial [Homalodisca vitripennis]